MKSGSSHAFFSNNNTHICESTFEETSQFQEAPSLSKKTNTNGIRYISNYDQFANSLPLSKIKTLRPDE